MARRCSRAFSFRTTLAWPESSSARAAKEAMCSADSASTVRWRRGAADGGGPSQDQHEQKGEPEAEGDAGADLEVDEHAPAGEQASRQP